MANVGNQICDYHSCGHSLGLSTALRASGDIVSCMTYFPQPNPAKRARRVRLPGSLAIAIKTKGRQPVQAILHEISLTGGLLVLSKALEEGDFMEVSFQTDHGVVRGMVELLSARSKSKSGCLQPFRFVAIEDEDHTKLRMTLESLRNEILIGTSQPGGWQPL